MGTLQVGDWVRARRTVPVTLTDTLLGSGVRSGTRGVVTETAGGRARVSFESGLGTVSAWVPARHLSVVGRDRGVAAFEHRARYVGLARATLAVFLAWPVIEFVAVYGWTHRGFSGVTGAFALGMVASIGDWVVMLLQDPVRTVIYLAFLSVLGRWAWR